MDRLMWGGVHFSEYVNISVRPNKSRQIERTYMYQSIK